MPHWIAVVAIVVVAWMFVTVVGGWLIGRGLGLLDRRGRSEQAGDGEQGTHDEDLRRVA